MIKYIRHWYKKNFPNNEAAVFMVMMLLFFFVIIFFGSILAPAFASVVIAFLLESLIQKLMQVTRLSRNFLVSIVFTLFLTLLVAFIFILLPLVFQQFLSLLKSAPQMYTEGKKALFQFAQHHPQIISQSQVKELFDSFSQINVKTLEKLTGYGEQIIGFSISSLTSLFTYMVYLVLVPMMVLFFLKDKTRILEWCKKYLPRERGALIQVWQELQPELAGYMKGKAIEILIVAVSAYIGFIIFGLNYSILLAVCVGLSTIIPYIGMILVTIPVVIIGLMQFGMTPPFFYMFLVYIVVQAFDGNILTPILFSGVVSLHPLAVILAVLFFGGIWGFWGLFFAIPLAALVKAGLKICTGR